MASLQFLRLRVELECETPKCSDGPVLPTTIVYAEGQLVLISAVALDLIPGIRTHMHAHLQAIKTLQRSI